MTSWNFACCVGETSYFKHSSLSNGSDSGSWFPLQNRWVVAFADQIDEVSELTYLTLFMSLSASVSAISDGSSTVGQCRCSVVLAAPCATCRSRWRSSLLSLKFRAPSLIIWVPGPLFVCAIFLALHAACHHVGTTSYQPPFATILDCSYHLDSADSCRDVVVAEAHFPFQRGTTAKSAGQ